MKVSPRSPFRNNSSKVVAEILRQHSNPSSKACLILSICLHFISFSCHFTELLSKINIVIKQLITFQASLVLSI